MKRVPNRIIRAMAEASAAHVLSASTRAAIERMAEEFAQDMLKDVKFRNYLRREAVRAARAIADSFQE